MYRSRHCTIHIMYQSKSHMYRKCHVPKWIFLCTEVYLKKFMYQSSMYRNSHVPKTPYPGLAEWSHAGYISQTSRWSWIRDLHTSLPIGNQTVFADIPTRSQ